MPNAYFWWQCRWSLGGQKNPKPAYVIHGCSLSQDIHFDDKIKLILYPQVRNYTTHLILDCQYALYKSERKRKILWHSSSWCLQERLSYLLPLFLTFQFHVLEQVSFWCQQLFGILPPNPISSNILNQRKLKVS